MKKIKTFVLFFLITFVLSVIPVIAQDAVKVDPQHYKIELENDDVRVLRINYPSGEKSIMHEHPKGVAVFLTDSDVKFTLPDGQVIPSKGKSGKILWSDAGKHLPENSGKKAMEVILVEMKNKPAAAFDLVAAKKAIVAKNREFMDFLSTGNSVGLANLYTTDARFMGPNSASVVGRSNIQSAFADHINAGLAKIDLNTTHLWGDEDMLVSEDEWVISTKDGIEIDRGKAIVVWKMDQGEWKIFRDIFNSDLPLPGSD